MAIAGARHRRGNAPGGACRGAAGGRRGGAGRCGGSLSEVSTAATSDGPDRARHGHALCAKQNSIRNVPIDSSRGHDPGHPHPAEGLGAHRADRALALVREAARPIDRYRQRRRSCRGGAGGRAECLLPFAVPDIWAESDPTEDVNGDKVWNTGENWTFGDDVGDGYGHVLRHVPLGTGRDGLRQ